MHALFIAFAMMFAASTLPSNSITKNEDYESVSAEAIRKHVEHLTGVYCNEESLKTELALMPAEKANNPMFRPQNIIVYPFWEKEDKKDEKVGEEWWYYLGWYASHDKEAALDEAILHFTIAEDGLVHTDLYSLPAGKNFPLEWKSRNPFDKLNRKELMDGPNTALYSQELPGGGIRFFSPMGQPFERTEDAASAYKFINFDIRFYPDQIVSKSSFLDAQHQPVAIKSLDFPMNKMPIIIKDF